MSPAAVLVLAFITAGELPDGPPGFPPAPPAVEFPVAAPAGAVVLLAAGWFPVIVRPCALDGCFPVIVNCCAPWLPAGWFPVIVSPCAFDGCFPVIVNCCGSAF